MPDLAAVIQTQSYAHIRGVSYVAWIYDKDQPRNPEADDPTSRYACIDMLGPFATQEQAKGAAMARISSVEGAA
jgi:hypothetical protein